MRSKGKQKAIDLINKYEKLFANSYLSINKQCALIAVDEILNTEALLNEQDAECIEDYEDTIRLEFWQQVKQEIINL